MREGRPSSTAVQVACWRALADIGLTSAKGFHDPTARHFLRGSWSWVFAATERRVKQGKEAAKGLRQGADLLALRTMIIDQHTREAVAAGAKQMVILGAGLDGRAYRLAELSDVQVFEVDHPATQDFKRRRAAELTPTADAVTFVPVDFESGSLDNALLNHEHCPTKPTVWIWEGVVMYLTRAATRETLRTIKTRSAPGSTLVVNYMTPSTHRGAIKFLLRLWGEPQISEHTPATMENELTEAGFEVVSDTGMAEWAPRFGASFTEAPWMPGLRVVVARV